MKALRQSIYSSIIAVILIFAANSSVQASNKSSNDEVIENNVNK